MIQRYEDYCPNPERDPCVLPLTDGKYVLFADHESEVAALRAEVERLRSACRDLRVALDRIRYAADKACSDSLAAIDEGAAALDAKADNEEREARQ